MSTTALAITSLALSSAALANTPTCVSSTPLTPNEILVLKAVVASLLVAPTAGAIINPEWDRLFSALKWLLGMALIDMVIFFVFMGVAFLLS